MFLFCIAPLVLLVLYSFLLCFGCLCRHLDALGAWNNAWRGARKHRSIKLAKRTSFGAVLRPFGEVPCWTGRVPGRALPRHSRALLDPSSARAGTLIPHRGLRAETCFWACFDFFLLSQLVTLTLPLYIGPQIRILSLYLPFTFIFSHFLGFSFSL